MDYNTQIRSVSIVGSGNVAEALVRAVAAAEGIELRQIIARNSRRGSELASQAGCLYTDDFSSPARADIYIIAVSDSAVEEVAHKLHMPSEAVAAHVTGCQPLAALPDTVRGRAVIYPFQTFTAGRRTDFRRVPLLVECDGNIAESVAAFARKLSDKVFTADGEARARVHLAGVWACNFVNHLYKIGGDTLSAAGLPFDILTPIIGECAAKAAASGNPSSVQTGPAVRGDRATCERHMSMISDTALRRIYELISEDIWKTSRKK